MTEEEAARRAREIWGVWVEEVERLRFRMLKEMFRTDSREGSAWCTAFLYRDGIFFDVNVHVVTGEKPRGTIAGFNGVQLYSFVRRRKLEMILTNGETVNRPEPGIFARLMESLVPASEAWRPVDLATPADLHTVLEKHRERFPASGVLIPEGEDLLEQRWEWMEEIERVAEEENVHGA